ncbi:unnamed protein product, partial [Allacma fusca]
VEKDHSRVLKTAKRTVASEKGLWKGKREIKGVIKLKLKAIRDVIITDTAEILILQGIQVYIL